MDKKALEKATRLQSWVQQEFNVSKGIVLVILADLLATLILSTDITTLTNTFGRSQTNRLALRKLQSAFRLLKKANLMKYKDD